jgi:hypothetical protein
MYYSLDKILDSAFYISEVLLILIIAIIDRAKAVLVGSVVIKTAIEIDVTENEIIVKTAPYKVLFWINQPSVEIRFKLHTFVGKKILYPVKSIYDLDSPVWQLIYKNHEIYIIPDYFNDMVNDELLRVVTK